MTASQQNGRHAALLGAAFDRADDERVVLSRSRAPDGDGYLFRAYWRELDVPRYVQARSFGELLEALAGLQ